MNYNTEQKLKILENAERFAGSFALALIKAYILADITNAAKIETAFPELLEKYLNV